MSRRASTLSQCPPSKNRVDAYRASHERIAALVRKLNDEQLSTVVTCCPLWSVKDLIGHLTGVLEDRRAGNMPTGTFDEWTAAQVARHRDEPIEAVLDTWTEVLSADADGPPSMASLSFDAVTHEFDLYQALGVAGDRSSASVRVGAERALGRMSAMLSEARRPGGAGHHRRRHEPRRRGCGSDLARDVALHLHEDDDRSDEPRAGRIAWDGGAIRHRSSTALYADGFFVLQPTDVVEVDGF